MQELRSKGLCGYFNIFPMLNPSPRCYTRHRSCALLDKGNDNIHNKIIMYPHVSGCLFLSLSLSLTHTPHAPPWDIITVISQRTENRIQQPQPVTLSGRSNLHSFTDSPNLSLK